ncbi:MAG: hypothetical protein ACRDZW_07865 [Acidimicrobiales bacterium]
MTADPEQLAYSARALAQAHPLTPLAKRFLDRAVEVERANQPLPEIGTWAAAGATTGYCLRRVEENETGLVLTAPDGVEVDLDELDGLAQAVAADLRGDDAGRRCLVEPDAVVAALDRIIHSEVDRRLHNWKESVDDQAWAEFEGYITWWVLKGYALRVAEVGAGALV